MTGNEKVYFKGDMRFHVVRVAKLLVIPDLQSRLFRLYSGNKTAMTINQVKHLAPEFCGLLPDPHEWFKCD